MRELTRVGYRIINLSYYERVRGATDLTFRYSCASV